MNILRVFLIAAIGLIVSCADVPTAPRAPPSSQQVTAAPVPSPQVTVEHGEIATAAPRLTSAAPTVARAAPTLASTATPTPLTQSGQPASWWFVFKFNAKSFPACGAASVTRSCSFGGTAQPYTQYSQQYVFASDANPTLQKGHGCLGDTQTDPLGATFDEIYNQLFHFVVWNDQFYDAPKIQGCTQSCSAPWGHSKGTLVWDDAGEGMVLQVTTPSWPATASRDSPRATDGNTLGCVTDNDVLVSQHFFALKLNKADVVLVLQALANSSVVTDPTKLQIVNNGGPADIQALVHGLGGISSSKTARMTRLSSGVLLISKPSD